MSANPIALDTMYNISFAYIALTRNRNNPNHTSNIKFNGVKARLLKKCRENNKIGNINYNLYNDTNSNDDSSLTEKESVLKKSNISNIIKNSVENEDNFDIENYYNETINF